MQGYFYFVVPIVVPASSQNHLHSTPHQPTRQEKTPYKSLIHKGLFVGPQVPEASALSTELQAHMFLVLWFSHNFPLTLPSPHRGEGIFNQKIARKDFEASMVVWVKSTRFRGRVYWQEGGGSRPV